MVATDNEGSRGTPEKPKEGRAAAATEEAAAKMAAAKERVAEKSFPH